MPTKMKMNTDGSYNGKHEIIRGIAKDTRIPRTTVERVIDALLLRLKDDILAQRVIHLPGVGTISYKLERRHIKSQFTQTDYGQIEVMYPKFRVSSDTLKRYLKKYRKKVGD